MVPLRQTTPLLILFVELGVFGFFVEDQFPARHHHVHGDVDTFLNESVSFGLEFLLDVFLFVSGRTLFQLFKVHHVIIFSMFLQILLDLGKLRVFLNTRFGFFLLQRDLFEGDWRPMKLLLIGIDTV